MSAITSRTQLEELFGPFREFLAEKGVFVIYKNGTGKLVEVDAKQWKNLSLDSRIEAIIWGPQSYDGLVRLLDNLEKIKPVVKGTVDNYIIRNYKKFTKKCEFATSKDRSYFY